MNTPPYNNTNKPPYNGTRVQPYNTDKPPYDILDTTLPYSNNVIMNAPPYGNSNDMDTPPPPSPSPRSPFGWGTLAAITPVYYACKLFGITPVDYVDCKEISYENPVHFVGRTHENVRMGCFHVSKNGMALWTFQWTLQIWTVVRMCFYLAKTVMQRDRIECSKDNYCSVFGMLLSHTVISPIIVCLVLARLSQSVDVLNMTADLLHRYRYRRPHLSLNAYAVVMFTAVIVLKLVTTLMTLTQKNPDLYYPYFIAYMVPLVLINLISILCFVTQQSYEDINRELEELCEVSSKTERASRLMTLMNDHWFLEDYLETMAETFGAEMIFITMDIYVQLLLYVYVVIWEFVVLGLLSSSPYIYVSGMIELSIIIGKFIYLCHRCASAVEEGKRVIFYLKHLTSTVSDDTYSQSIVSINTIIITCDIMKTELFSLRTKIEWTENNSRIIGRLRFTIMKYQ
ncbi:Hypothetical protein CINCED_3A004921 [Cinara cedri]|uniref:Gustatory receptor n=1 Tax=Cinara cedri TaxID=506608 RepID=A0A5E4MNK8_9HEMI|nr:Hypothetical protein CINCED_3A004921 [Cinara cedri]